MTGSAGRRYFAPEVIQTSLSDCGPAALKCIAEGFGVPLSYGRLREACQTDVDGSSIDALEAVLVSLGFAAEQTLLPVEHLLSPAVDALPALVVVEREGGALHFVVAWRAGRFGVQVMDPAVGRGWLGARGLREQLYRHAMDVPAEAWREWAASASFQEPLRERLTALGVSVAQAAALSEQAVAEPGWRAIAGLDACTRLVEALVSGAGLRAGTHAAGALEALWATVREEGFVPGAVPAAHWSAVAAEPQEGTPMLRVTGALVLSVRGRAAPPTGEDDRPGPPTPESPELRAALSEKPAAPWRELRSLLLADGWLLPVLAVLGVVACAVGLISEGVALRDLMAFGSTPSALEGRARASTVVVALLAGLLVLEAPTVLAVLTLGRRLELRLRHALFRKLPLLPDRYLASRPVSDMGARGHSLHVVRSAPELVRRGVEAVLQLGLTTLAIGWLDARSGAAAAVVTVGALAAAWLTQPLLAERELKLRTHHGGLGRFTLDALLGLTPLRAHSAESAVRRGHSQLLREWRGAGRSLQAGVVWLATAQACWAYAGAFAVVWLHLSGPGAQAGTALLLAYWALSLPSLGAALVELARQAPGQRNVLLRLLEPLGAEDEAAVAPTAP
ncbi:MAG: ABC transporter permease, partial [Myxococcaceae bacterium]|nr:ABC transporter permease [Myxococcaceae bacterium]